MDAITLPVRTLEEGDADYIPAPYGWHCCWLQAPA